MKEKKIHDYSELKIYTLGYPSALLTAMSLQARDVHAIFSETDSIFVSKYLL